jgi:nucleoside-diphosphate-sugar epimerase
MKVYNFSHNISLIGASGFVGTRLIDLLKDKYTIVNFDKQQSKKYPELTTILDIRNKGALLPLLNGFDLVVLLAAEHRDDVSPISLYYDVNVEGTRNVLEIMDTNGIKNIIFTSSVAVYGLNKSNPDENHPADPFNHYGKSKWQAEEILRKWYNQNAKNKTLRILRPTVIFGERNRGNVYNLLKQIASGRFIKTGNCNNKKSMAYVGNIVAFIDYLIENDQQANYKVYNYIDKPDLSMNELIKVVGDSLNKKIPSIKIPYWLGMLGGYGFDFLAWITHKKLPISSVRVKKFCATSQFDATKVNSCGFIPPYSLSQGIDNTIKFEFVHKNKDDIIYESE